MNASEYKANLLNQLKATKDSPNLKSQEIGDLANDSEKLNGLVNVLTDESASDEAKQKALTTLDIVSVFSSTLPQIMPDYVNALRGLLDAKNATLRQSAFSNLAEMKDEIAQERLKEELKSDKKEEEKMVPTHVAIALLGSDEKSLDHEVLRGIAKNPPNKESLIEAVRHLPGDEASFEVLKEVMEDDTTPLEARAMIPDIISNQNPEAFLSTAKQMLQDKGSDHEIMPYLAQGVASIQADAAKSEVEDTKALFKSEAQKSSTNTQATLNNILFPGQEGEGGAND